MKTRQSQYMATANAVYAAALAAVAAKKYASVKKKSGTSTSTRKAKAASRTRTRTVTTTKKRKVTDNNASENRFRSLTVSAKIPSAMAMAQMSLEPQWFRVQGLTQYDVSNGFYGLWNRVNAAGVQSLPIHVWDLTCHTNWVSGTPVIPQVGYNLAKTTTAGTSDVQCNVLYQGSQAADATVTINDTRLRNDNVVNDQITSAANAMRKSYHHWSHIKMNLYGVRKRATRYLIQLVQVKQVTSDFIDATGSNDTKKKLFDYLARPFIFNNLQMGDPLTGKDMKVLRSYECTVAPITQDDYAGVTSTPNIVTLNWFVNHNKVRHYDWARPGAGSTANNASWDQDDVTSLSTRVDPRYRVYLLVRALCPEQKNAEFNVAIDPISEPSYDVLIRQKFSDPQ